MDDLVSVSEAAQRLGLNKSNVSRQVRKLGIERDADGKFSFASYRRARERDLNPLMARSAPRPPAMPPGSILQADLEAEPHDADDDAPERKTGRISNAEANATRTTLQARLLQIQIQEKEGTLVNRAELRAAIMTTFRMTRDAFQGLPGRLAGELAGITDVGEIRARLDAEIRALLDGLVATLRAAEDAEPKAEGAEPTAVS